MVALCRCITHHQLGGIAGLQLGQPHRLYRVCKALYVLAHMPDVGIILLQDGNAHVGALGGGVKHGGILPAVTVQILQQERRKHRSSSTCTCSPGMLQPARSRHSSTQANHRPK
ncbi:Uncharacterised protein [uncultured Clostridium sp.]|nr:Uncharacterised protein [uncultured Clostridium sp.]